MFTNNIMTGLHIYSTPEKKVFVHYNHILEFNATLDINYDLDLNFFTLNFYYSQYNDKKNSHLTSFSLFTINSEKIGFSISDFKTNLHGNLAGKDIKNLTTEFLQSLSTTKKAFDALPKSEIQNDKRYINQIKNLLVNFKDFSFKKTGTTSSDQLVDILPALQNFFETEAKLFEILKTVTTLRAVPVSPSSVDEKETTPFMKMRR